MSAGSTSSCARIVPSSPDSKKSKLSKGFESFQRASQDTCVSWLAGSRSRSRCERCVPCLGLTPASSSTLGAGVMGSRSPTH
eukprot:3413432-Amphidinium_carterae.4